MKTDVYSIVTERIVAQLEKGFVPWHRPWTGVTDGAISHRSGRPYSLLNQLILGKEGEWCTKKEIEEEGGRILDGEKPSIVVFWKYLHYELDELDENGEKKIKSVPYLRYNQVWHIDQTDGMKKRFDLGTLPPPPDPIESGEEIIGLYFNRDGAPKLKRFEASNRAYYSPTIDEVVVPMLSQYKCAEEFYSTLFHEMTHSTGYKSRLARKEIMEWTGFGSHAYSKEELVAEMGAAYLCTKCGLSTDKVFNNSAAYIQSWLRALKNDKKLIVSAASKAEAAAKYIIGED